MGHDDQAKVSLKQLKAESTKEEKDFRALIPMTGFIGEYMRYTDLQESPGSYHFWIGMCVLSAILQRRAYISKGVYNVYPNLFMILVAPSGRCRKSRALSLGVDLIQDFDFMNIVADKTTPESLLEALMIGTQGLSRTEDMAQGVINLQVDSVGFIKAGELSVFLNKQSYTAGMVNLLTDLFDCPKSFKYLTRNKRPIELNNVAVTFVGASTPEWLATSLPEAAFEGGFMSRIIFVVKNYKDRTIALPRDPEPGQYESLRRKLIEVRKLCRGRMELSHSAREWYIDWYSELDATPLEDEQLGGFLERKPDTILKVATLLNASDDPENKIISVETLKKAETLVSWTQARMFKAFKNVEMSRAGSFRSKIMEIIEQNGEISRRALMRKFGSKISNVKELEDIMGVMVEAGEVEEVLTPNVSGPATSVYRRVIKNET